MLGYSHKKCRMGLLRIGGVISLLLILSRCETTAPSDTCYEASGMTACILKNNAGSELVHVTVAGDTHSWPLPYPAYQFLFEDISNNGEKDILVGVVKKTRFDTIERKRVFVFKIFENEIRPLWLGSRLGMPIHDFEVKRINGENYLQAVEEEQSGKYAVTLYQWDQFGFKFIEYLHREKELHEIQ